MRALVLLWCITIVAAIAPAPAAAAPLVTPVPLTAPVAALGARLGVDPIRDRARFVPEIVRRLYTPLVRQTAVTSAGAPGTPPRTDWPAVDLPLQPTFWSETIFKHIVPPDQLLASIFSDRRAALLSRALWSADDETLAFYSDHGPLLTLIYERGAAAFAAFGGSIRVHGGRVIVPGGTEAEPLWAGVVGAQPDDPVAFLRVLFSEAEGRTAYLYDVIATAAPDAQRFALGLWIDDPALRARRFTALSVAVHTIYREWHVDDLPFSRPLNDLAILLFRVSVGPRGEPAPPAQRKFWAAALDASPSLGETETAQASHPLVDAAWLLEAAAGDMYARGDRLEQFAFGQRVFGRDVEGGSETAAAVVRELPARRMLLLALERLGITSPAVYAAATLQARDVLEARASRFWATTQIQGALAMVVRMTVTGTIDPADVEPLLRSLFAVPAPQGEFRGALALWLETALARRLPAGPTWEARLIAGLAGRPTPSPPRVEWEDQVYRLDLAYGERRRIASIRQRQGGPDLDVALALAQLGRDASHETSANGMRALAGRARDLLAGSDELLVRPPVVAAASGAPAIRDPREWLRRSADELERSAASGDVKRAARTGESLLALSDVVLGHALLSMVYAVHLGDPEGPALLGSNVALRHDFGFERRDGGGPARGPWALPRQDFQPGVPWHVVGSLVGMDVALASLSLRRLSMDSLAEPPRLPSIERDAFAVNVGLINPRLLDEGSLQRLVARIGRGRARVRALPAASQDEVAAVEQELDLDGSEVRILRGNLQNEPGSVENQFSLADLVVLGGGGPLPDEWGASSLLSFGCICTRFPTPGARRVLLGRTQLAMMATVNVEMNLEMAQRLATARLPAALLPSVLATAMQDFVDRVAPSDANDFTALTRYPPSLSRGLVDDFIAATAAVDGPLVPDGVSLSVP